MLHFTNGTQHSNQQHFDEIEYYPIVISNATHKQKAIPHSKKSQKKIVKTHSNSKGKHSMRRT